MPLAPATANHLHEIIQFCKIIVDFDNPQTMNNRSKKADYLTQIFNAVNNAHIFRGLDEALRVEVFEMVKINLIRVIPPIPLTIIYADSRIPINTNSWLHLSTIHKILYSFVQNSELSSLQILLTKDFLSGFAGLLESPDPKETQAVESFIQLVFDTVSGYRQIIFQIIIRQLLKYSDNYMLYPCVAPCLRFLLHFLKTQTLPLKTPFYSLYKNIIFPLICSQMSYEFFLPFNQLAEFYETQDGSIAAWTLQELVRHWPKTDTNKECAFLSHFTFIAPHIPAQDIEKSGYIMFSILKDSLASYNYKTNVAALNVISSKSFILVFASLASRLIPMVLSGIDRCSTHWNVLVSKAAVDAARIVMAIHHDAGSKLEIARQESEAKKVKAMKKGIWTQIVDLAEANNIDFDKNAVDEQIKDLFD